MGAGRVNEALAGLSPVSIKSRTMSRFNMGPKGTASKLAAPRACLLARLPRTLRALVINNHQRAYHADAQRPAARGTMVRASCAGRSSRRFGGDHHLSAGASTL